MTPPLLVTDTHPLVYYMTAQFGKLPPKVNSADRLIHSRQPCQLFWD